MIRVERLPAPAPLNGADSAGARERGAWERFYAGEVEEKPSFQAYRHKAVKETLEEMFQGKCAYCESRIGTVTWGDVEHYRPKSTVLLNDDQRKKSPGYWWLAAEWTNLLLACNRCNSPNRQKVYGSEDDVRIGKGVLFPLRHEVRDAWPDDPADWPGVERDEDPLLLDPCTDEPRDSLTSVVADDSRVLLRGKDAKGDETIRVLGLNRFELVRDRGEKYEALRMIMQDVRDLAHDLERSESPQEAEHKQTRLAEKLARLETMTQPDQEYLLMSRECLETFQRDLLGAAPRPCPQPRGGVPSPDSRDGRRCPPRNRSKTRSARPRRGLPD